MKNNQLDTAALIWFMGYNAKQMHDLPDLTSTGVVYEGVNIKIETGNMLGGWEISVNGPRVVWFVLTQVSNQFGAKKIKFERLVSLL
jgi:hypothetical protein